MRLSGLLLFVALIGGIYAVYGHVKARVTSIGSGVGPECLALAGSTTTETDGTTYITGNLRNDCDRAFDHVTITFKLDHAPGAAFDLPQADAYAYGRDIKPGEVRAFQSALPVSRNATYQLDNIRAY